jgi:hypothetical protein
MKGLQQVLVMAVIGAMFSVAVAPESQTTRLAGTLAGPQGFGGWLKTISGRK